MSESVQEHVAPDEMRERLEVDGDLAEAEDHQAQVAAEHRLGREPGSHVERRDRHGSYPALIGG